MRMMIMKLMRRLTQNPRRKMTTMRSLITPERACMLNCDATCRNQEF